MAESTDECSHAKLRDVLFDQLFPSIDASVPRHEAGRGAICNLQKFAHLQQLPKQCIHVALHELDEVRSARLRVA
jgi:hypothetical protein